MFPGVATLRAEFSRTRRRPVLNPESSQIRFRIFATFRYLAPGVAPMPQDSAAVDWRTLEETRRELDACNASLDPNLAEEEGRRLRMPGRAVA